MRLSIALHTRDESELDFVVTTGVHGVSESMEANGATYDAEHLPAASQPGTIEKGAVAPMASSSCLLSRQNHYSPVQTHV